MVIYLRRPTRRYAVHLRIGLGTDPRITACGKEPVKQWRRRMSLRVQFVTCVRCKATAEFADAQAHSMEHALS